MYKYSSFEEVIMESNKMEVRELDFTKDFEEIDFSNIETSAAWGSTAMPCELCK